METSLYSSEECEKIAKEASLRYIQGSIPGILRKKSGRGFSYYYPDGIKITDKDELHRVRALAIPPAYKEVWICPFANGHIQATGRDDRNRKQYHYHPLWQEARQKQKFDTMLQFGEALFLIREHVNKTLNSTPFLNKNKVICAILYLLDTSCIRIGNTHYALENKTYGITTLRKKHLSIKHNQAILDFAGKNSKTWHINLRNKKIVNILKRCEDIPGYELFKYYDENKMLNVVTSQDINYYLKGLTDHPFTAKDFRTWIASREFFCRLLEFPNIEKLSFTSALKEVADLLGHTPKICQKSYIHPQIIFCWKEGKLEKWKQKHRKKIESLSHDELLLFWLKKGF
jgi:DNA topoisomerase-1